jgi:hypothetical protein
MLVFFNQYIKIRSECLVLFQNYVGIEPMSTEPYASKNTLVLFMTKPIIYLCVTPWSVHKFK